MPSVLLECGIILNRQEENEMRSREFIEKMSNIVLRATMNFFDHKTSTLRWSIPLISLKLNTNNPDFIGYTIPEVPRTTGTLTSSP
jgi:hypothetical protein